MKTLPLLLAALTLALTGCSTVNSRIKEHASAFSALDAAAQERLRKGRVDIGDSEEMAYVALGQPTRTKESATSAGKETTWIYKNYYEDYAGTALMGYRRAVVYDRTSGRSYVYLEPVYTDVYRQRSEEYIRLVFKAGKVSAIEQDKSE
jgi:hypothetical protein